MSSNAAMRHTCCTAHSVVETLLFGLLTMIDELPRLWQSLLLSQNRWQNSLLRSAKPNQALDASEAVSTSSFVLAFMPPALALGPRDPNVCMPPTVLSSTGTHCRSARLVLNESAYEGDAPQLKDKPGQ